MQPYQPTLLQTERPGIGPIVLRPFDLAQDIARVHDWVNRPYARFWGLMGKSLDEIAAIYREQIEQQGVDVRMACRGDSGEPLFLIELYDPRDDTIGRHYAVQPGDCGFHVMLAPAEVATPGLTYQLMLAACAFLFSAPAVRRMVCEPDLRNRKMISRLYQLGFQREKVVHLAHKTGLLMSITREGFEAARRAGVAPPRPVLRWWPARVRWHFELGRLARGWRRVAG